MGKNINMDDVLYPMFLDTKQDFNNFRSNSSNPVTHSSTPDELTTNSSYLEEDLTTSASSVYAIKSNNNLSSSEVSSEYASYDDFSSSSAPSSSKPKSKISTSDTSTLEFSSVLFAIDFDEKAFEDHLNSVTSQLKDDFSHSSLSSETYLTLFYEFSFCLRIDNTIKDASAILVRKKDQILHFYSKDRSQISAKVFKTELSNNSCNTTIVFSSSRINFDFSEECSIISLESEKNSHECRDLDANHYFRHQLLEDQPQIYDTKSSKITGSVCDQHPRFNAFQTSSKKFMSFVTTSPSPKEKNLPSKVASS